ncbi:MAG: FtsB family cell division protein [Aquificaceae bacterium]
MRQSLEGRKSLRPELLAKALFFLVFLYTLHNLFMSQYSLFKIFELKRSILELHAKVENLKRENKEVEKLLELMKKYPEHFKEKFAREYMQMQRDGEYLLLLRD